MKIKLHPTHRTGSICKRVKYKYCKQCGIVYLRNDVTRKAMKAPCPDKEDENVN